MCQETSRTFVVACVRDERGSGVRCAWDVALAGRRTLGRLTRSVGVMRRGTVAAVRAGEMARLAVDAMEARADMVDGMGWDGMG
jgi:hypothetical protein